MEITKRRERNSVLTFLLAIVAAIIVGLGMNGMDSKIERVDRPYELEGRR